MQSPATMVPKAQMSIAKPYSYQPTRISGARYHLMEVSIPSACDTNTDVHTDTCIVYIYEHHTPIHPISTDRYRHTYTHRHQHITPAHPLLHTHNLTWWSHTPSWAESYERCQGCTPWPVRSPRSDPPRNRQTDRHVQRDAHRSRGSNSVSR